MFPAGAQAALEADDAETLGLAYALDAHAPHFFADQLFHDKNALKLALKFFKSAEIALTPRDVSKNTIWSGGFPSYSRIMTLECLFVTLFSSLLFFALFTFSIFFFLFSYPPFLGDHLT